MLWQVRKCIPPVKKKALIIAPVLGLPVQDKFQLYVYEQGGLALGMVTQLQSITPQPVGYLSKELDQVAKGWLECLQALQLAF
jgi:hypothetical protein